MNQADQIYRHWISSWHKRSPDANVLGVKEKLEIVAPDGTVTWKDNLRLYHDPIRPFWVTKPQFRDHLFKKEFENILHMDAYYVNDSQLEVALAEAIGYDPRGRKLNLRGLCANPYVYGADIETQVLVKQRYINEMPPGRLPQITRGFLDIEAEPIRNGKINVLTFMHEKEIYTVALREYCKQWNQQQTRCWDVTEEDCLRIIYNLLGDQFSQNGFNLHFKILDTEIDMLKWIFSCIHKHKTDYISIWNMGFDIPKIIERIGQLGFDPKKLFSHPAIPDAYQFVEFHEDKSELVQHFTDRWHWVSCASYSQFIDGMCLYARLRKTSGKKSSYALDVISDEEVGKSKLHFGAITNHHYMQKYRFLEYIAYNINDVTIMWMMEQKNSDIYALNALSGYSLLSQFARQTVMVRNDAYNYGRYHGRIPASAGPEMLTIFDKMLPKAGGAVLPPNKAVGVGIHAVREFSSPSLVSILTNDLDVSSMYPSIMSAFNISKESSICTVLEIQGYEHAGLERFFSGINQPEVNTVDLTHDYLGLPNYKQMVQLYDRMMGMAA